MCYFDEKFCLSEEDVIYIRDLGVYEKSISDLSNQFKISRTSIKNILLGRLFPDWGGRKYKYKDILEIGKSNVRKFSGRKPITSNFGLDSGELMLRLTRSNSKMCKYLNISRNTLKSSVYKLKKS